MKNNLSKILLYAKKTYPYIKPYMFKNILTITLNILSSLLVLIIPLLLKYLIDDIITKGMWNKLPYFTITIAIVIIGRQLLTYASTVIYASFTESVSADARNDLFIKILYKNMQFFNNSNDGDLLTRITRDSGHISTILSYVCEKVIRNIIQIILVFIILFRMNFVLALLTVITIPVFLIINNKLGKKLRDQIQYQRTFFANLNNYYINSIKGIKLIKNIVIEDHIADNCKDINDDMKKIQIKTETTGYKFYNLMEITVDLNKLLVLVCGGYFVSTNFFTLGALLAFYSYINYAYSPFIALSSTYKQIVESIVGLERYFEYIEDTNNSENVRDGIELNADINNIDIKNLSFNYTNKQDIILDNINLNISKSDKIALLGKSGQGKTTLSMLLKRLYSIEDNHIFINGIDFNKYSLQSIRKNIFYLSQEAMILDGTIKDNFKLFNNNITEEQMVIALKKACIYDDIMSNENSGLDTLLSKNASVFSGGQKQRICLAFLFAQNANVIIVDEPFTGIDKETTAIIWRNMQEYLMDKIVIFIDHIFEDNTYFNKHLMISDGTIMETNQQEG